MTTAMVILAVLLAVFTACNVLVRVCQRRWRSVCLVMEAELALIDEGRDCGGSEA